MKILKSIVILILAGVFLSGCVGGSRLIQRGATGGAIGAGIGYAATRTGEGAAAGAGAGVAAGLLFGIAEELFFPPATPAVQPAVAYVAPSPRFNCDSLLTAAEREACKKGQAEAIEKERRAAEKRAYEYGRWGYSR